MGKTKTPEAPQDLHEDEGPFARGGWWQDRAEDQAWHAISEDPQDFNLDDYAGLGSFRGKTIADLDQVTDQIWTGRTIDNANGVITFGFVDTPQLVGLFNNPQYGFRAGEGFRAFSPEQEAAARLSIQMWDDILAVQFRESQGMGADILFANSSNPAQAYAYYPIAGRGWQFQSDVFVRDPNENWTNEWFTPGGYGNTTLIHEIGHTIGLSHPGEYNGAGATTYAAQAEYAQDSMQYTIMSYWSGGETGASTVNWTLFLNNYAQTPMLHDIYAAQQAYGADMTTRTGDTVYGFGTNAGYDIYDFAYNAYPYMSIWDAGGTDTIDLSGYTASQYLNLNAGTFSSIGAAIPTLGEINDARVADGFAAISQASYTSVVNGRLISVEAKIEADTGVDGIYASGYDNFSIAYGVTIENGIGGQAKDVIVGNEVANMIDGQGGNDVLFGNAGDDLIIGGLGNDTMSGGEGADTFDFDTLEMADLITDFDGGEGDMIDLSGLADDVVGGNALAFVDGFTGVAGQVTYDAGTGALSMDANGDMAADFTVTLQAGADLDATMLILAA